MPKPLTENEVNRFTQLLDDRQRAFLEDYVKQSKKSKWLEQLARKKGIVLQDNMSTTDIWNKINDWELKEILDGGYGERPYRCECGMPLRFCFIVHHRQENKTYRLGETCLTNYTMLSPDLIKDITNGFHTIDLERDDILTKFERGWRLPEYYEGLPLPDPITQQIGIGLPLSTKQLDRIEQQFKHELQRKLKEQELARLARIREQRNNMVSSSLQVSSVSVESSEKVTYEEVLSRHLEQLKQIRENEFRLTSPKMHTKWLSIQQTLKGLRRGQAFDYSKFLMQMFELLYYLGLY
ncbi:hypothetical protein [Gorillibacterium massiliense]|uniref:hypothetical protein n=1 Tax=Gorillibacterium massiliense TaxID=1280390 RepID=UPI0004AF8727|nr:hypothetical protein [Gorillibacterium massiliense]